MLEHLKVAVIHEWFVDYSGSERVVEQILKIFPHADLFATVEFLPDHLRWFIQHKKVHTSFIQNLPFARTKFRSYLPLMPLAIEQFDLSSYDLIISSCHAVAKGVLTGPDQLHIAYVHSPIRYAWDLQHQYLKESGLDRGIKSWLARWFLHQIRIWDSRTANGVDYFVANSQFIARRIRKVYRREAQVIYPPVDVAAFTIANQANDIDFDALDRQNSLNRESEPTQPESPQQESSQDAIAQDNPVEQSAANSDANADDHAIAEVNQSNGDEVPGSNLDQVSEANQIAEIRVNNDQPESIADPGATISIDPDDQKVTIARDVTDHNLVARAIAADSAAPGDLENPTPDQASDQTNQLNQADQQDQVEQTPERSPNFATKPPVVKKTTQNFYLTASRFVPYKKVDLIVAAFRQMPDKRLLVIGDGPNLAQVEAIAQNCANITLIGYQPPDRLKDYMQRAKAFVFAAEEDFGITPVEALACGTPVIAYGKGGVLETVTGLNHFYHVEHEHYIDPVDGLEQALDLEHKPSKQGDRQYPEPPTGIFFWHQTTNSLITAVENFELSYHEISADACRQSALKFAPERFRQEFASYVKQAWMTHFGDRLES
jgi:glycosyltransferase involved in cell wall biosynthesis